MAIKKKNQLVGVDIGSHSIKVAEIDHNKRGRILKNFGLISLPDGAVQEGDLRDGEALGDALRKLFRNLKIRNKNLAVALSGYPVITKRISLPDIARDQVEEKVHSQAEQFIPFDINDVNLDFDILDSNESSEGDQGLEIMLVAAKKDVIDAYVDVIASAGFNPMTMDTDSFALQNAAELALNERPRGYAIVNVGAEELSINTLDGNNSLFSRDSAFGGRQITDPIMRHLKVSYDEAEAIKMGQDRHEDFSPALSREIAEIVMQWAAEIKRALDFVAATYSNATMEKIYMCGGSSKIKGFSQLVESETGLVVEQLNPFTNLIVNDTLFDPAYMQYMAPMAGVAVGLALRSIDDK